MNTIVLECTKCGKLLHVSENEKTIKCNGCNQILQIERKENNKLYIRIISNDDGLNKMDNEIVESKYLIGSEDEMIESYDLIKTGNELIELKKFTEAKKYFLEYSAKHPDDYRGWWGLLVCRTRHFTIKGKDNLFEKDLEKYYQNFMKTAPDSIKERNRIIIEEYLYPSKNKNKERINANINSRIYSQSFKSKVFIVLGFVLMVTRVAIGFGFFIFLSGVLYIDGVSKKLKLSESNAKTLSNIFYIISLCLLIYVDLPNIFSIILNLLN